MSTPGTRRSSGTAGRSAASRRRPAPVSALDLARHALQLYESEPARAEQMAQRSLRLLERTDEPQARSIALQALGMVAWERQSIPEAVELLRSAVRAAEGGRHAVTAAGARSKLAVVLSYAGDDAAAIAEAEAAGPFLAGVQRAELHHHVAGIFDRQGRLPEALALATSALRTFRRHGDVMWQARALNNRAIILAQLGEVAAAQRQLELAEQLYGEVGMTLGRLKARNNRAWVASMCGDVPGALQLHDGLQHELAALGVPPGLFRLDHAIVLLAASLPAEALVAAERAAAELAAEGMEVDSAEALLLACSAARLCGAYDDAERLGRRAAEAFGTQHRPAWVLRAQHALIEISWLAGRNDPSTETLARTVANELESAGWTDWARDVHLVVGQMALARGDLDEATEQLRLAQSRGGARRGRFAETAGLEAGVHAARGDLASARRAVRRGLRQCEEREALLGATELRVRAARQAAELADLGLRWAVSSQGPMNVLTWSERRRAASLRLPPVRPPRHRQMAKLLASRRAASFNADQLVNAQDLHAGPDLAPYERVAALDAQIRALSRTIQGHGVMIANAGLDRAALIAALDRRALVELVTVDDELLAVTLVDGRAKLQRLASLREVHVELDYTRFALGRSAVAARDGRLEPLLASLERLDELVMAPLARRIDGRDIVVVPVATLHTLPWGSLPSLVGRAVSVAPSATTWLSAMMAARRPKAAVVVVAGPGLDHAEAEALAVAHTVGAQQVLIGGAATAQVVARALDGASIAHLACHGRYRSDNPMFSSLLLADGPLIVYELERLHRAPELVVLSACDSAVGSASAGEELMGLTASLLSLGSRTLVGSVAPVRDEWTRPLMLAFHERLATGEAPAAALAAARIATRDHGPGAWATSVAFGCFGAGW